MVKPIKFLITPESEILQNVPLKEVAQGIVKLIKNAEDLISIADKLLREEKRERSIVLITAALEECVKITHLVSELAGNFPKDKRQQITISKYFWRKWKNHEIKQGLALSNIHKDHLISLKSLEKFKEIELTSKKQQVFLERARKLGLYVDFDGNKFRSPLESFESNQYIKKNFDAIFNGVKDMVNEEKKLYGLDPEELVYKLMVIHAWFNQK